MFNKKFLLILIIWLAGIYYLSSQPNLITVEILKKYNVFKSINALSPQSINLLEFFLRKSMHVFEFFILTFLFYFLFKTFQINLISFFSLFLAPFFAFLFACIDEFHQYYVPTRDGKITDVIIDSVGILGALLLIIIINLLIEIQKKT